MECDEEDKSGAVTAFGNDDSQSSVNSLILDYYKKFGRKRDLEQYFSLSTAQSDIRDPTGVFWRRIKTQNDSSDSGERKSDSPQELCRISIRCSAASGSQDENTKTKAESVSPPIITEEGPFETTRNTDDDSVKSDDNHSQKSFDVLLDISTNRPLLSPSSSITCQRKLEWDSLADVGYSYESDRKTSASSLSTLERLALKQQYSNNDSNKNSNIGPPTAHSTPLDENDLKTNAKKGAVKKTTKIYKKDVDYVEVSVPQGSEMNTSQAINVNLTKHISFNVERDGMVTVEHIKKDVSVSPEKVSVETEVTPQVRMDKEIQTSMTKSEQCNISDIPKNVQAPIQRIPVLISLNTLKKRNKRRKLKIVKRKIKNKKVNPNKENIPIQEKGGEQLSEADSFEYMPGHIYNQNQMTADQAPSFIVEEKKSSLESSGVLTTDSSKGSRHSFTKDLEKSIDLLKAALHKRYNDSDLKNKLIQEVCQRLLQSKYRDDESTTDFLSGLSFGSKKLGLGNGGHTTTSTSDANNSANKPKLPRPKKSILRVDKFNPNAIASTSQSAPNLPAATNSEKLVTSNLMKSLTNSNTESDSSSRGKTSSDGVIVKTSSEEFYQKYLEALKREEAYKRHLRDKEMFLKQKLVSSDNALKVPVTSDQKVNNKLKDLINDLTRNNYDDGSGDASKLEGGSNSNIEFDRYNAARNQRSHSVFTLSSGNSDCQNKKLNLKKRLQNNLRDFSKPGPSKDGHYCCCPHHLTNTKFGVTDSSVQVNIKYDEGLSTEKQKKQTDNTVQNDSERKPSRQVAGVVSDSVTGDIKYVCLCNEKPMSLQEVPENFLIYKCSRLTDNIIQITDPYPRTSNTVAVQCATDCAATNGDKPSQSIPSISKVLTSEIDSKKVEILKSSNAEKNNETNRISKSSQTNLVLNMLRRRSSDRSIISSSSETRKNLDVYLQRDVAPIDSSSSKQNVLASEATRCIQTEISIDPKISDPCLSDVNIINDVDAAKLVCVQDKQASRSSDNGANKCQMQSDFEVDTNSEFGKSYAVSDETSGVEPYENINNCCGSPFVTQSVDNNIRLEVNKIGNDDYQTTKVQQPEALAENFTIPIQGTNMTLMVSIGSKESKAPVDKKIDEVITQGMVTDKTNFADHATSVEDECSKGVQFENGSENNKDYNNVGADKKQLLQSFKTSCLVSTCKITEKPKFNTYPKNDHVNQRKPFLRTNTDTEMFDKCRYIQTDLINQKDIETQQSFPILDTQVCKVLPKEENKKSCGCSDKTAKCKGQCEQTGSSNIEQFVKIPYENSKDKGTQKDLSTENLQTPETTSDKIITESKANQSTKCDKQEDCNIDSGCQTNDQTNKTINSLCKDQPKSFKVTNTDNSLDKVHFTLNKKLQKYLHIDNCLEEKNDNFTSDKSQKSTSGSENHMEFVTSADPILDIIQDITKRYSKKDIEKNKRKKCFKEIMTVLNYLLDTDECTDLQSDDQAKASCTSTNADSNSCCDNEKTVQNVCVQTKKLIDKGIQSSLKKSKSKLCNTESSDLPISTDLPGTSSDSATCKVLNKIKKECDRYHQKRCKCSHVGKKCEVSSSTSVTCEQSRRTHHCNCRGHKCKGHRSKSTAEKMQRKSVAYNLIIQTSESMISEETICDKYRRPLKNIVVKVPSRRKHLDNVPFKEMTAKIERNMPSSPCCDSKARSKSLPNESEVSSTEELLRRAQACTVREYLEINRPDFVKKSSHRQNCLKFVNESRKEDPCASPHYKMIVVQTPNCVESFNNMCNRGVPMCCNHCIDPSFQNIQNDVTRLGEANERAAHRDLLSLHVEQLSTLRTLSSEDLRHLAREIGVDLRRKNPSSKIISEKEMKKHSEKIYKTLPEVVQKKQDVKKENIKKTNLLMANIFKKNLQKKTLRGDVNLSNYSTVIKI